jgi:hypothetical protein
LLAALSTGAAAQSKWRDTPTGIDPRQWRSFPLQPARLELERTSFPEVLLQGKGRQGRTWTVRMPPFVEARQGDLDGNGTTDLILFSEGPYLSGSNAATYSFTFLLMDRHGMPEPWFAPVFHGWDGQAWLRIADLDGDGRAEFVDSDFEESGCWVNRLYRYRAGRAVEFAGLLGGFSWPFASPAGEGRRPIPSAPREQAIRVQSVRDGMLEIEKLEGCATLLPQSVVFDQGLHRDVAIATLGNSAITTLLERAQAAHARFRTSGFAPESCYPSLVRASAAPSR